MQNSAVALMMLVAFQTNIYCAMNTEQVKEFAVNLSKRFKKLFVETTQYENVKQRYENAVDEEIYTIKTINVAAVSKTFSDNLQGLLLSKIDAVIKIKKKAEELYDNYTYEENIQPFEYFNSKGGHPVQPVPTFFTAVNASMERSHVQVPSNIHEQHKDILNDAKWSVGLDETFTKNLNNNPTLLWQYFCGASGMIRTFPGVNDDTTILDLYDCRRRMWYSQAINSPKDVVILLDLSGSMTGSHLTIARIAVKSFIDTLQQDDFLNVLTFKEDADFIFPCLKNLIQATSRHKELFRRATDNLPQPDGISDIKMAFRKTLEVFQYNSMNSSSTSSCTKVIVLISDGVEKDNAIHKLLGNFNSDVIIFSYIVGNSAHKEEMMKIACRNGGDYYDIPTVGNVWNEILKHQSRLAKPMVNNSRPVVVFSPLYLDQSGLGMMVTISTGVFGQTHSKSDRKLLGVAGIDIRITLLEQQYPLFSMGVFGHGFVINNNGMVVIHPKFREQEGYLPDPETLYLVEIEHTLDREKIQYIATSMINGETGCVQAEIDWLYFQPLYRRVVRFNATYCYHPATSKTSFSTCVSMPMKNTKTLQVSLLSLENFKHGRKMLLVESENNQLIQIANWDFCNITSNEQRFQPASKKLYPTAEELHRFLKEVNMQQIAVNCSNERLFPLLMDAYIISNLSLSLQSPRSVQNIYFISTAGYIFSSYRYQPPTINRDVFSETRFTHPAAFTMKNLSGTLVFSTEIHPKQQPNVDKRDCVSNEISIGKVVTLTTEKILVAVIGMSISASEMQTIILDTSDRFNFQCNHDDNNSCLSYRCDDVDNMNCYLLDENAYIVFGNQNKCEQGYYFGYINGILMLRMEELGIFIDKVYEDPQFQCSVDTFQRQQSSSSNHIRNVFQNWIVLLNVIATQIVSYFIIFVSFFQSFNKMIVKTTDASKESCTKGIKIHTVANHTLSFSESYSYSNECNLTYAIETVHDTNLLLVLFRDECNEDLFNFQYSNQPVKVEKHGICQNNTHYRKVLPVCFKATNDHATCKGNKHFHYTWQMFGIISLLKIVLLY